MTLLSKHFRVQHRYQRSVNLERDGDLTDSLEGYILTSRASETLERILVAYHDTSVSRAWTLTGVYGTGKSAFANFLAALSAPRNSSVRKKAEDLLRKQEASESVLSSMETLPEKGLVRAVVTGRREPIAHTVLRGLARGAEKFWSGRRGRRPNAYEEVMVRHKQLESEGEVDSRDLAELTRELAVAARSGLLLMIDELGKILEYAAESAGSDDLYLLQQLAELPADENDPPVLVVGLLHQSFSEYGHRLSSVERAEWEKIQGRFEDVPFRESPDQILRLMGTAIESSAPSHLQAKIRKAAASWGEFFERRVENSYVRETLQPERVADLYPLHPVSALVLPRLCYRYAQNDRSLFTFLASTEGHALASFLATHEISENSQPYLRPAAVYDYFIDSARASGSNRLQFLRWVEVHDVVHEARGLGVEKVEALKVIGLLNLVGSGGAVRASKALVLAGLVEDPSDEAERDRCARIIRELVERQLVTYRQQVDEYRIWQGSDFNIEGAIKEQIDSEGRSLSEILREVATLSPIVAQRHSYLTGTLRYLEVRFEEDERALATMSSEVESSDGLVVYWLGERLPEPVPALSNDHKPMAVIPVERSQSLERAARELFALQRIEKTEVALQSDGVARKEVRHRLAQGREILDGNLHEAVSTDGRAFEVWLGGDPRKVINLNRTLSGFMDEVFHKAPILWNEIINRRDLTSQGARAQRELITAILEAPEKERLGIQGKGPDFSAYSSVLSKTKIHREEDGVWGIYPPEDPDIIDLWQAVEDFCLSSVDRPRPVSELYKQLEAPPYGVRQGIIPIFLSAVLVYHADDVSVYQDGSFLPILGVSHFELLIKDPQRFALKHFALKGVRSELFRDLEDILRKGGARRPTGARNATLLTVIRPLVNFASSLPRVTKRAKDLSEEATAVREALLSVREPDRLVFEELPSAVGHLPFNDQEESSGRHKEFRGALFEALKELQMHYPRLLESCQGMIEGAFGVKEAGLENLRENLRVRASCLIDSVIEPSLKSFLTAASDRDRDDNEWLESLIMVIADKPAENWREDEILGFQFHVAELARRFISLLTLQDKNTSRPGKNFVAKRVTITDPTGHEVDDVVWLQDEEQSLIEDSAKMLLENLASSNLDAKQRRAVLVLALKTALEGSISQTALKTEESLESEEKSA